MTRIVQLVQEGVQLSGLRSRAMVVVQEQKLCAQRFKHVVLHCVCDQGTGRDDNENCTDYMD